MTQKETLEIMKTGANVFLTGPAGSGKTHVLRDYLAYLRENKIPVGITASTGIAATHMGGTTIHSWSGIGIKDKLDEYDIDDISSNEKLVKRIMSAKVLVIDEISMLHHYRLDMIDRVLRYIRRSDSPFGGLQIIVSGDFFQLPPISRDKTPQIEMNGDLFISYDDTENENSEFAYHSRAWKSANFIVAYLESQFRQNDPQYLLILNAIRNAVVSKDIVDLLGTRHISKVVPDPRETTRLYSHNVNVDAENEKELRKLPGKIYEYKMEGHGNKKVLAGLKKSCMAPEILRLKLNAKVMFVKNNFDEGYVNGTLGTIDDCDHDYIMVRTRNNRIRVERETWVVEDNGKTLARIEQYPLRLAWAITIHKSQGMSLDSAHIDLSNTFEKGMGYVALSRLRSLSGLYLLGLNKIALEVHEEALEYDKKFQELSHKHGAEFAVMSRDELKRLQATFLR